MAWDFSTDPEFDAQLRWMRDFVDTEIEPLALFSDDMSDDAWKRATEPLKQQVKDRGLWACHLDPELGGQGYGQVKLALMHEILGRCTQAPAVFGNQAPDSGNSEILAHYGTPEQKARFLEPLLRNEIVSCFSMTEPQGGADPKVFRTRAVLDGDEWVVSGHKWFSSNARFADFFITMAVTDPDNPPYQQFSMFLIPADTPGINIIRNVALGYQRPEDGTHAYIHYDDVRVPVDRSQVSRRDFVKVCTMAAAAVGLSVLIAESAVAFSLVKYLGGLYLVYLGLRMLLRRQAAVGAIPVKASCARRAFVEGVTVEALNVKTALFFLAFLPQFTTSDAPLAPQLAVLGAICVLINTTVDVLAVLDASRLLKSSAAREARARLMTRVSGSAMIALGVILASTRRAA